MREDEFKDVFYPAIIHVKVFIANQSNIEHEINQIVLSVFPDFSLENVKLSTSAHNNFISLTYSIHAESKEPMDKLYHLLHAHPAVKMVL